MNPMQTGTANGKPKDGKTGFDCGWNDVVHGIEGCPSLAKFLEYYKLMHDAAQGLSDHRGYSGGALACFAEALSTGRIPNRREVDSGLDGTNDRRQHHVRHAVS